ncbi:intraflagellar transport protein 80 homolog isoform X15 [Phymastichus coffea]|uniref:intraflagellar transport protein 80 homolog isoform X15 n=1 Tax=Phymastichus coffea TaxID=108790 RepID=UPI00273C0777|nr:intraflagellar transport protein 80 homolog isoform X15 [Phymastichus coffea]
MKFKISQQQGANSHSKAVTCVTWISSDEIYSCGDDHSLMCWKFEDGAINSRVVAELPEDFYPTDMQWQPRPAQASGVGAVKKQSLDVLLISTADGKFHLVSRAGRVEKSVQAHTGATLSGKWSQDGSALMTAGEDGLIKVWSRSGMLRSTAVRGSQEVFASAWSPDGSSILYSQASLLLVQSLTASGKPTKWVAHDGLVLAVAWNPFHDLIVSGGEDCRYKVWDANGAILYASGPGDQPITALSWCSSGSYFAVGSFNAVKLCDRSGWPHSTEKLQVGSVYDVAWSSDGTQAALACSSGSVPIAHVIERRLAYGGYEATLIKRKAVLVSEVGSDVRETLDIAERVVQLAFGFDHLVAVTPSQCHVYSVKNWNTPAIVDLKGGSVSAVLLADKHFLLLEWNAMSLFNYQGRSLGAPRWKNMTAEPLYPPCVSVCCDTIVARDQTNRRLVHVLEVSPKKPLAEAQPYAHAQDVTSLGLNYVGGLGDRQLALVDANRDLFLVPVRSAGFGRACRIAAMAQSVAWASDANVLAGMLDTTLSVWLCPSCLHCGDRKLARRTRVDKDSSEFGKQPAIVSVSNGLVTVRRGDGALVVSSFYAFVGTLHRHILNGQWDEAVSVCRIVQSDTLWTCLAVMAIDGRQLNIAEEACAAVARFDKVDYIRYIKEMPNETERLAEMALLAGDLLGAEGILLQSAMIAEAIRMNLQMYNWSRALELALKHKKLLAEVLDARKRYLETLEKREVNRSFLAVYGNIAKAQAAKRVRVGVPIDAPRERVDGAAHPSLLLPGGAREGEGEGARGSGAQAARVQGRREEQRRRGEIDDPGEGLNRCGRFCSSASFVQSAVLSIFIR